MPAGPALPITCPFKCRVEFPPVANQLQNKVADVLHSLGVPFAEEYAPRANFFNVDIASEAHFGMARNR